MAYTVQHLYEKVLEGTDKMGSDFYTVDYVMNRLEAAVYDFIGETVKYIENTQEIRDDIRTLYKPYKFPVIPDPTSSGKFLASLPSDYQHLMSGKVLDKNVKTRKTRLLRHGQLDIFETNPNTKATAEYPTIVIYDNYIQIVSTGNPEYVEGYYVKKPTFGNHDIHHDDLDVEIAVDLPEHAVDKIIKTIIRDIFTAIGDPRVQIQSAVVEDYRNR
jgi:hypothetical protein